MDDTQQSPIAKLFASFTAYQLTAAMRAAIELDLFTAIGEGNRTVAALAKRCSASERGIRMLADSMAAHGFLTKSGSEYGLTQEAETFLDRRSPAAAGSSIYFTSSPHVVRGFDRLTDAVRKGGTAVEHDDALTPEHPMWVEFARAMAPIARFGAQLLANVLAIEQAPPGKVLDVAAGHGWYGITLAQRNPTLDVFALDWRNVLEVAKENAREAGVADRHHTIEGDAFTADIGGGYQWILLTNILHHFDAAGCETLIRKMHGALAPGGRLVTVEFVPDETRTTPVEAATFSLVMLAGTPGGDAYTVSELDRMLRNGGFAKNELHHLTPSVQHVVISTK